MRVWWEARPLGVHRPCTAAEHGWRDAREAIPRKWAKRLIHPAGSLGNHGLPLGSVYRYIHARTAAHGLASPSLTQAPSCTEPHLRNRALPGCGGAAAGGDERSTDERSSGRSRRHNWRVATSYPHCHHRRQPLHRGAGGYGDDERWSYGVAGGGCLVSSTRAAS